MNKIETEIIEAIKETLKEKYDLADSGNLVMVEMPKDTRNGDYSTNIAMRLAKVLKKNPQIIAAEIVEELKMKVASAESIEIAGPGFINFKMKKSSLADVINTVIKQGDHFGENNDGNGLKVLVEYVSANPTGTLHLGHARGAAWGDSVCRLLKASGYDVLREYYVNDAGHQIDALGESLYARYREAAGLDFVLPEDGYHGADVRNIAQKLFEEKGTELLNQPEAEVLEFFKKTGRDMLLERIKNDLSYYRCEFDSWISEKWIVSEGRVDKAMQRMVDMGLTYEKDNAIWFKSTEYGDDKDRVLRKSDGYYTYLTPDIANHVYKFERGYQKLVNFWGADHHGYIPRMKAAIEAMGYPKDSLEVDIIQMVRLVEDGKEVKMSKRTGNAVTIRELCDDIGVDCARYFFLCRALDTHMDFDLSLARQKTNDNPVYYAQYAYARICSVLRQANAELSLKDSYDLLTDEKETELLKYLASFPSVVADSALTRSPNKVTNYIQKLATYFHSFYASCKINDPGNPELTNERLALAEATRITLKNALTLLGVDAPERM
ncbi:MAG: arginine--tRNA ligase [Erysipelotrichaceae bacterium]|nr:arginine--tRNA ligase [Erysipelotrichaceae bacterium]